MKFREDGTFHILQFADIQEIPDVSEDTLRLMNAALERARPDLVVLSGDQLKGADRRFSEKGERAEETIRRIMKPVTDRKIPFAVTFGDQDRGCGLPNEEQMEIYRSLPGCVDWLKGLILDGIIAGLGAVLGFVPQILVLFILLAFLESCGYMARIAFVMDRIFRKFGLSGKSFIPILIGTGCGIPGIMASRTIENERDRRMTIMTTTFIPCGAKLPFIAMIAGAIFGGSPWIAPAAYFIGMAAIVCSGIILKKTKLFSGDPAPFVMELPAYHWPTVGNVLRSMWERGWSFIKKAGTVILLSTIVIWFTTYFGVVDGTFRMLAEDEIDKSILAVIGNALAWIFIPLGWGKWESTVASITGLVAKENIVGTLGILFGGGESSVYANIAGAFTALSGFSFLTFNLLCAPCFAAMGAIKREMNNAKWTAFAIGYQCVFAYAVSLVIYQLGMLFTGSGNVIGSIVAFLLVALFVYLLVRPYKEKNKLDVKVKV